MPVRDDLIGILRTILRSIEIWRSRSLHSQGYLRYVEGNMKKLGVSVRQVTPDFDPVPEPEEDSLLTPGRAWVDEGERWWRRSSPRGRVRAPAGARGADDRRLPAVAGRDRGHGRRTSPPGVRRSWPSGS